MAVVETELTDGLMVIRMNRPERLNALGDEMLAGLAEAWRTFRDSAEAEVAIFTGTGRAFCAGADLNRLHGASLAHHASAEQLQDAVRDGQLTDVKTIVGLMWLQQWRAGAWPLVWTGEEA